MGIVRVCMEGVGRAWHSLSVGGVLAAVMWLFLLAWVADGWLFTQSPSWPGRHALAFRTLL